jgi:hypothetical protein
MTICHELGIAHLLSSPVSKPCPGSTYQETGWAFNAEHTQRRAPAQETFALPLAFQEHNAVQWHLPPHSNMLADRFALDTLAS